MVYFPLRYKLFFTGIALVFVLTLYMLPDHTNPVAWAVETTSNGFGISVSPSSGFLNLTNAVPGDSVSAPLIVSNDGDLDFCYDITAGKETGDALLFSILELFIHNDDDQLLYSGKLSELENYTLGILGPGISETLYFTVLFPFDSGNRHQGLSTTVKFLLTATEHPTEINSSIVWDPPLERPDVHVRRGTVMPIKFHLVNDDGTFDTTKRGIDLLITGIDDDGEPVEYVFSVAGGSLEWEECNLHKPHYKLMFDTRYYPVAQDTYYTVTAKYSEEFLGSTSFKSGH
ncbi:CalY family protein [Dethiobacter alkaliphilus]|uniref:CalY family protein n=1 Tax=Dethiobacter alkaliphilus TaxID=427926 RepID=UPI0022280C83|nr:CalY family protein [Dethiobacter alkaliphilus]MCW3490438.1 CalY family protein [Dethiobacter alkaliphilus]